MPYERRHEPLLPRRRFAARLARHAAYATLLVAAALALGTLGFRLTSGLAWIDSFLNAAMILTGMGPVDRMNGAPGKLFSAFYALFSGLAFLAASGIVVAPLLHRLLHRFHMEDRQSRERV